MFDHARGVAMPAFDPFTPETAADARAEAVKAKFRGSLVERAERRTVTDHPGGWVVAGDPKLGDAHPAYSVALEGQRYRCTCYTTRWGEVRAAKVCSHVLAVILYRKRRGGDQGEVAGAVAQPAPATITTTPDPRDPRFASPPLPAWVRSFRSNQWAAVTEAVAHFQAGKKVVILDAPTGTGKTLLGELVRRELGVRAVYTCTNKTLQDQVLADFPYARILKGRANYPTLDAPAAFRAEGSERITCDDCENRSFCGGPVDPDDPDPEVAFCDYQIAKHAALTADLAVFNTSYLLAEANYVGRFHPELIIADECDELEAALMGFVEVSVGPRDRARLGVDVPARKTVESAWVEWLAVAAARAREVADSYPEKTRDKDKVKQKKRWARLAGKLAFVRDGFSAGAWVYDHTRSDWVTFKPVTVHQHAQRILWRHAPKWLCMSATVISPDQVAAELGLADDEWASVSVSSTFPPERRPIHVVPRADLTYKTEEVEWPKAAAALQSICDRHPGERILAHTQSYRLNGRLFDFLAARKERPVLTYKDAAGRELALATFRDLDGAVLLAPSLERGVSLDDEACRVVVVVKTPFASTGDPQVSKRLHGTGRAGDTWYAVKTIRSLVQSTGRGMRHADDWCQIYILDKQFIRFYRRNQRLFPKWWKDALDFSFDPRQL